MSARHQVEVSPMTKTIWSTKSGLLQPNPMRSLTVLSTLIVVLSGCAHAETFGEHARKVMADVDKDCRKRQLGPYEPEPSKTGIRNSSCDILFLKPYDPLENEDGRFAHSIKLPDEGNRKEVYRPGMTDDEYFNALCREEAGEFIFNTVEKVEGVLQMRPQEPFSDSYMDIVFHTKEMRLDNYETAYWKSFVSPLNRNTYKYFEIKLAPEEAKKYKHQYLTYSINQNRLSDKIPKSGEKAAPIDLPVSVISTFADNPKSRYGFISRGVRRLKDVEHGIQGSELIVIDIRTNKVIGYERVYRQFYFDPKYLDERTVWPRACGAKSRWINELILTVLKPAK